MMRKILLLILAACGIVFSVAAQENSLLWEVSGKKTDSPSYLYGTIHIQSAEVFAFDKVVYDKLTSCESLAVELLIDELDKDELSKLMLMEEGKLSDYLTDEQYAILDSVMKKQTGQSLSMFGKMKPFFLSSQILQTIMPKEMPMALDMHFIDTARKMDMELIALEEVSDQIGAIDKMSIEEQCDMLMEQVTEIDNSMEDEFAKLVRAYVDQNLDSLAVLTRDTALPEAFGKELIIKRNKGMAKEIHKLMKKQTVFAAFGAAHLVGEEGVIALLRKRGYTVEPVYYQFRREEN
ncbi:MAG: TraB/GumN family protein [Bacteroidales bacterium]